MKRKLNTLFRGGGAKVLLENFISLAALQLIGTVLSLVTLPYLLRVLGFTNYGIIVLAVSFIAYFQSVIDYSFRITATRDIAMFRDSPAKVNIIYSKVLTVKILLLIISFVLGSIIICLHPIFYQERVAFFLTMLLLLGYTLFPEWYFQGIEKMRYISILNIAIKLFFTICVFIFINEKEDYWIYPLLQSAGAIGGGIVAQIILIKKYKLKFLWLKPRRIKETIYSNFPVFINQFFPTLYNNTSSLLLGLVGGATWLGVYDAIKKIIDISIVFLNVISRVFFPYISRRNDAFYLYKRLLLLVSVALALFILGIHQLVFWYLDITYVNAFYILLILSCSIVGYALYDIFGLNYFLVKRQDRLVMVNTIRCSLIGLVMAFPLIYWFGIIGAALNLCITRWLMGGVLMVKWQIHEKNEKLYRGVAK